MKKSTTNANNMKYLLSFFILLLASLSLSARVKYTSEMEGFLGTWEYQDGVKNDYIYRISVSDGWVIVQYRFVDNYCDGAASKKLNIDYTYRDGVFYFEMNYPSCDAYNDMSLQLHEGSLVETTHHRDPESSRTWNCVYEKSF